MPQADLSYSSEIQLDPRTILATIESVIASHDDTAGACKGRAHPLAQTHHKHVLLRVRLLDKPHRDEAFMQRLTDALGNAITPLIPPPAVLGIELGFLERNYASWSLPESPD
ncbi:hypothetical protein OS189_10175 [Sulfitobacter sp. F26169L]|uniref:hypothetical protein n=1 Tax=Sulfitobacter sp. F26169L TaxID=2996015 RepID=UPI002260AD92|nr:hypothetical protein [Sulfitobacter sp. F26169L]MCX7566707.1 hypothetical protein [Sulfitobacter sp. F26169L]